MAAARILLYGVDGADPLVERLAERCRQRHVVSGLGSENVTDCRKLVRDAFEAIGQSPRVGAKTPRPRMDEMP